MLLETDATLEDLENFVRKLGGENYVVRLIRMRKQSIFNIKKHLLCSAT